MRNLEIAYGYLLATRQLDQLDAISHQPESSNTWDLHEDPSLLWLVFCEAPNLLGPSLKCLGDPTSTPFSEGLGQVDPMLPVATLSINDVTGTRLSWGASSTAIDLPPIR